MLRLLQAKGSLRVALIDEAGTPIPGYDLADCRPLSGDSVSEEVRWSAGPDLGAFRGSR